MANLPPLSTLPDFLPLGQPGSPELRACVVGTFTDSAANLEVMRAYHRRASSRLATHLQPSSIGAPARGKAAAYG